MAKSHTNINSPPKKNPHIIHYEQVGFIWEMLRWFSIHQWINVIPHINGPKDRNIMIIPIDTKEKPLTKSKVHS